MTHRTLLALALAASTAVGMAVGTLLSQEAAPQEQNKNVRSITGVGSGVKGSAESEPEKKGVDQVAIPPEDPQSTPPAGAETETTPDAGESQRVQIEGVEGTEGIETERENIVEIHTSSAGTMQSIRGIKGIDTVMLQNLETVLRMQAPPPPPEQGGGGGVRAAAALMTMEADRPPEPEEEVDLRQELTESELEGS